MNKIYYILTNYILMPCLLSLLWLMLIDIATNLKGGRKETEMSEMVAWEHGAAGFPHVDVEWPSPHFADLQLSRIDVCTLWDGGA